MTFKVIYSPEATLDLESIYLFIFELSASARTAGHYTDRIRKACDGLCVFPMRGTLGNETGGAIRVIGFEKRVAIAFTVSADQVRILRVLYGGRSLQKVRLTS